MGHQSAGTGSPITFRCPVERREWEGDRQTHKWERTGRTKLRTRRGVVGIRSMLIEHEYTCVCGHTGWSNHIDMMMTRLAEYDPEHYAVVYARHDYGIERGLGDMTYEEAIEAARSYSRVTRDIKVWDRGRLVETIPVES